MFLFWFNDRSSLSNMTSKFTGFVLKPGVPNGFCNNMHRDVQWLTNETRFPDKWRAWSVWRKGPSFHGLCNDEQRPCSGTRQGKAGYCGWVPEISPWYRSRGFQMEWYIIYENQNCSLMFYILSLIQNKYVAPRDWCFGLARLTFYSSWQQLISKFSYLMDLYEGWDEIQLKSVLDENA